MRYLEHILLQLEVAETSYRYDSHKQRKSWRERLLTIQSRLFISVRLWSWSHLTCVQVVRVVSADVSDAGVGAVLEKAIQGMGCDVDVLVNCAGITHTATMLETPCEKYKVSIFSDCS